MFNQEGENISLETAPDDELVAIYKIEQLASGRCYFGYSNSPEQIEENIALVRNDELQQAIADEGIEQFSFDVIFENIPITQASGLVAREIENRKNLAVYNRNNPISQRYSNRLMVELFCQHFNLSYEEVLERPADIKNLSDRIEKFEKIVGDVKKAKLQVKEDFSNYNSIEDIVNFILGSIDDIVVKTFAEKYEQKKKRANAIDFQDMILYAVYLFERYPDIHTKWSEKYDFVLVDEFQDISPVDFRLINSLSDNLFAVGDDDQAIYGFRGGDSEIMQNYYEQDNVTKFEITRNYRSTMTIVEQSRVLIEHNQHRISKNLRAENTMQLPIEILETTNEIEDSNHLPSSESNQVYIDPQVTKAENLLIRDLSNSVCHKIAILVRYRSEVDQVREMLRRNGFEERVRFNPYRKKGSPCNFIGIDNEQIRVSTIQIRVSTIHSVKGKEYDKVILIHNALGEDFPFSDSDSIEEERRVFYVAMTRAKQELVVIGGECLFVWELRKIFLPELKRLSEALESAFKNRIIYAREQLEEVEASLLETLTFESQRQKLKRLSEALESAFKNRIIYAREQLEEVEASLLETLTFEKLLEILTYEKQRQIEILVEKLKKQHKPELNRLRHEANEAENARKNIEKESSLRIVIEKTFLKETFLKELIPVLDNLEVIVNSTVEKVGTNNDPTELTSFCEKIRSTQTQFLDSLKIHAFTPVESLDRSFNPDQHEEIQPGIFTDEAPKDIVVKELQRGYILNNQVYRKAKVVVSKGKWDAYGIFMDLEKPVCLVTDQKIHFFEKVMILAESIKGVDLQGSEVRIQKPDVMFAFSKNDKETVTPQRQPVEEISESNSISDDFLKSVIVWEELTDVKKQRFYLKVSTRSGYALRGYLRAFDKDALCMWINEQFVVVYRHDLLKIERIELKNPPVKKNFSDLLLRFRDFVKKHFN